MVFLILTFFLIAAFIVVSIPYARINATEVHNRQEISELSSDVQIVIFVGVSDADLEALPQLTDTKHVRFEHCPQLRGPGLKHLTRIVQLNDVHFEDCRNLEDSSIQFLERVEGLKYFSAFGPTKLTDGGVLQLESFNELSIVMINNSPLVTLAGLKALHKKRPDLHIYGRHGDITQEYSDRAYANEDSQSGQSGDSSRLPSRSR